MDADALRALISEIGLYNLLVDPGRGNLNLRAIAASILGPMRIAHGVRVEKRVTADRPILIASNAPADQRSCLFVEVTPVDNEGVPTLRFSSSEETGRNGVVSVINPVALVTYQAVLLPYEQLFAEAVFPAGLVPPVPTFWNVIVSTVAF